MIDKAYEALPFLSERHTEFVENVAMGMTPTQAAKHSGYSNPGHWQKQLLAQKDIAEHIAYHRGQHAKELTMTREKIQDGFMEAITLAKELEDPSAMIRGWAEVAKLTGLNAPEKKEIELNVGQTAARRQLEELPEVELMQLVGQTVDIIDGEFEDIFDDA